ncbi:unnamed protein product [Anisakis simplex]|uniref:CTNNB1_binding domain-containing protein n=1 Tax=Anisakis simplex TaxID=6269 RepID=A0A0M3K0F9_ANISI|nr:unnamed protein product [Anisakis simplex]
MDDSDGERSDSGGSTALDSEFDVVDNESMSGTIDSQRNQMERQFEKKNGTSDSCLNGRLNGPKVGTLHFNGEDEQKARLKGTR